MMAVLAVGLCVPLLDADPSSAANPTLPWLLLLALWVPFELVILHLQYGDDPDNSDNFVLTEIPLALGVIMCEPVTLIAVAVLTPVLIDVVRHNKSALKQVFNGVNKAVEVGVALSVYQALDPSEPLSLWGWLALCASIAASSLTTSLLVSLVISLATETMPLRDFVLHSLLAMPMALIGATLAFSNALALQHGLEMAAPLGVSMVALLLLLRGFTIMTERHVSLIRLHALGQRLGSAPDVDSVMHAAIDACGELLDSRRTTVFLPEGRGGDLIKATEGTDGRTEVVAVSPEALPDTRGISDRRMSVVAAAPLRAGREVVLAVAGRRAPVRPYQPEDLRVLEMAAHQTAQALHTAQLIDKLRHDALHDPLTDLPNRRAALDAVENELAAGVPFSLACVGLLDLERINAALGHDHGDTLLVEVARRLREAIDPAVRVARVADDGFAIVVPQRVSRRYPEQPVTTALAALARPFTIAGTNVVVRSCAGVTHAPPGTSVTAEELMRRADIAMRHARANGGSIQAYVADHDGESVAQLALAAELRTGIDNGELVLHAQPQVRLDDGVVTGMEMLVRWNHPTLGLLQPAVFVPLAEQTGLERELTAWVLEAAVTALAEWRASGLRIRASINVSGGSLDRQLSALVRKLLQTHRVPGDQLVIEITESALTNVGAAAEVVRALRDLGVRVSIDDFGTGFSSMSRLRSLNVDEIKIDRSFVRSMLQDKADEAIVRSVVELARSLGLACVAEGIEDRDVYATLRRLGCDLGQGFLMAEPMPTTAVVAWVADGARLDLPVGPLPV